jgi:hypothetical protein
MLLTWSMIRKSGHRFSEKIMLNQFYCVVLAPKPAGRSAHLSGDELIPLPGGGENRLVGVSPMARAIWSLRGQSGRRRRLAVAQKWSIGWRGKVLKGGVAAMRRRIHVKGEKRWT